MNILCKIGIHKWIKKGHDYIYATKRKCLRCNKKQEYVANIAAPEWGSDSWEDE